MADSLTDTLITLARAVETEIGRRGWDQPALLWPLVALDVPQDIEPGVVAGFMLANPTVLEGHPADSLVGVELPQPDLIGCALVTEGWDFSPAVKQQIADGKPIDITPSQDPQRIEVRIVTIVLKDGTSVIAMRQRDGDVIAHDGGAVTGRIINHLRRLLDLPAEGATDRQPATPHHYTKLIVCHVIVTMTELVLATGALTADALNSFVMAGLAQPASLLLDQAGWPGVLLTGVTEGRAADLVLQDSFDVSFTQLRQQLLSDPHQITQLEPLDGIDGRQWLRHHDSTLLEELFDNLLQGTGAELAVRIEQLRATGLADDIADTLLRYTS